MLRYLWTGLLGFGILAGCAAPNLPSASPAAPANTALGTIRFALQNTPDVKDVPTLMALDALEAQGYTIEVIPFDSSNLVPEALDRGDAEIGAVNSQNGWAAIAKGAKIRSVVSRVGLTYYLVAKDELKNCPDLLGKRVGGSSTSSATRTILNQWLDKNCPGDQPVIITGTNTADYIVGMASGALDAAQIEIEDWAALNMQKPGRFHLLMRYGKEFPGFLISTYAARRDWAEQNPEMVKDFIRALLQANRELQGNPLQLRKEIAERLSFEPKLAVAAADGFMEEQVWDVNGGLNLQQIQATLDILRKGKAFPVELMPEDVADLQYLNDVLVEIGRK